MNKDTEKLPRRGEEELNRILGSYAQFLNTHIQKYNLHKYGLDPDDIMQDIRIRIWKLVQSERVIFSHGAYLKRIINSAIIDQLRRIRREDHLIRREKRNRISELGFAFHEAARRRSFEEALRAAVEELKSSRRQVVKLYLLGFSIPEIASYLSWSLDRTRNLLYRGLADLRKTLKNRIIKNE